jgi:hypothetical protein
MPSCWSTTICIPLIERLGRHGHAPSVPPQSSRSHSQTREPIERTSDRPHWYPPIDSLNDDVLLNVFYIFGLDIRDEEKNQDGLVFFHWDRQRWWYKLAQVCQQWRKLIFASPYRLNLQLLCARGIPVPRMLTHSPPLPLIIFYNGLRTTVTAEDEENILFALQHRDRVRRIHLALPASTLQRLIMAINEQFPILERMSLDTDSEEDPRLVLPKTFQAPLLDYFSLRTAFLPIGSPLLTTTVNLVTLVLDNIPTSAYVTPSHLLTWLSHMPQLVKLVIRFHSPLHGRDVEPQQLGSPVMTHFTLPSLRVFFFRGVSTYLEDLFSWISAPLLRNLEIEFSNQLTFTIPNFSQFMRTSGNFELSVVWLDFSRENFYLNRGYPESVSPLYMRIICRHLVRQVSCAVQILSALAPVLSVTEKLTVTHTAFDGSSERDNEVDLTQWRELLRPFSNVKILCVQNELVKEFSRSLHSDDENTPLDLLSNLKEIQCSRGSNDGGAFTPFIKERQAAGHPVNLRMVDRSDFPRYR